MLSLVKTFGLSHVCARSEFENIGAFVSADNTKPNFNFPYLDIYFYDERLFNQQDLTSFPGKGFEIFSPFQIENHQEKSIKFYFRGAKDQELEFQNLFEYLLVTSLHGKGLTNFLL